MLGMVAVEAAPGGVTSGTEKREEEPQPSVFMECIQKALPSFPYEGKPTAQQVKDCAAWTKSHPPRRAKREELEEGTLIWEPEEENRKRDEEELIWEPEERFLESRGTIDRIIDTVRKLDQDMAIDKHALCYGQNVHNEFVFVPEFQKTIEDTCKFLTSQIDSSGISKDGGVGKLLDQIPYGHDKRGHQLKDKCKLTISYTLGFYPPTSMAIESIKELASGVYDLCNDALLRLGAKDDGGCVDPIKYFRPSKAHTFHDLGQIGGFLGFLWNGTEVASMDVVFLDDK